jgi:hypothetical protein
MDVRGRPGEIEGMALPLGAHISKIYPRLEMVPGKSASAELAHPQLGDRRRQLSGRTMR